MDEPKPAKKSNLRIKRTMRFFLRILKSLTDKQKTAVRQLGFGGLLEYDVASIPTTLAYWLLEHFRHLKCTLKLPNCDEVEIEAKDVELVLGFPNGEIGFERCGRMTGINYLETIPLDEKVDILAMQMKFLEAKMMKDTEGGPWLKNFFLQLMETALIEMSPCGYVKPRIVDIMDDLPSIKKHNWCQYLLDNLMRTHELWENNKSKVFSCPIVFLVAFYVDKVVHRKRIVPRAIPRVKGWTAALLKQREDDEIKEKDFGLGRVSGQYEQDEIGSAERARGVGRVPATENDVEEGQPSDAELGYMRGVGGQPNT